MSLDAERVLQDISKQMEIVTDVIPVVKVAETHRKIVLYV